MRYVITMIHITMVTILPYCHITVLPGYHVLDGEVAVRYQGNLCMMGVTVQIKFNAALGHSDSGIVGQWDSGTVEPR